MRWTRTAVLPLLVLAAFLSSCTATEDDNTTNVFLTIVSLTGNPGDEGASAQNLFADVCDNEQTSAGPPGCTVRDDFATVTLLAQAKDPLHVGPGPAAQVVMERYRVSYVRADGRNVPGVEVPYSFDGAANFLVPVGTATPHTFTVVRQQAKLEPPLINLRSPFNNAGSPTNTRGGAIALSVIAEIDFFGRDVGGRPISVKGYLNITFGDFQEF